jgi:hypothetical protein
MDRRKLLAGAASLATLTLGGGLAYASDDGAEGRIMAPDAGKAKAAALDHTGGGRVTDTEVGDEEGYYEIEVTRDDGTQTDVHLDRDLDVLTAEHDGREPGDEDGSGD